MGASLYDVVCAGHAVVDVLIKGQVREMDQRDGDLEQAVISTGGDALNEAIVLSRLGLKSAFLGRVGEDLAGELIKAELNRNHVDASGIVVDKEVDTTISVIPVGQDKKHHFWCHQGGNNRICLEMMKEDYINKAKVLNIGSIVPGSDMDFEGVAEVCARARKNGVITSADAVLTGPFRDSPDYSVNLERLCSLLKELDYFLPSEDEALEITGKDNTEEALLELLNMGAGQAVIKLGKKGCLIYEDNKFETVLGYPVRVADTVGAGDNFVAGFTAGLSRGWSLKQCAMFANAAAALSVTQKGAVKAASDFMTVRKFMEENGKGDGYVWNW